MAMDDPFSESDFYLLCPAAPDLYARFVARYGLAPLAPDDPDLYLADAAGRPFLFGEREGGHHVLGIPYGLHDDAALLAMIAAFDGRLGWGSDSVPPPDALAGIVQAAHAPRSLYRRFRDGVLVPGTWD